jgi:hypothetical protein
VLHTRTAIEYRAGSPAAIAPPVVGVEAVADKSHEVRRRLAAERALDEVLADSFPASDPPSWTPGTVRPGATGSGEPRSERDTIGDSAPPAVAPAIGDVSRPANGKRAFLQGLVSLAGASGIALLAPVAILLVGLPLALSVRGVLEAIGWLLGVALH